jgi:serine/threonine protein kinase
MTIDYDNLYSQEQFAADDPRLPESFQVYRVKRKLGQGPIAFDYEATRIDVKEQVRLKVLRKRIAHLTGIEQKVTELDREYGIYSGEHLLRYHGFGRHDDNIYFEFDYVDAVSLRELVDDVAPFHPDLVAMLALEVINGLNEIHGAKPSPGMGNLIPLHRNLTPGNILITGAGKVLLTDIDMPLIATAAEREGLELPYTPLCFQSPEQLLRGYADRRSDIFSLGMVMMEMLCRRLPYVGYNIHHTRQNLRDNRRERSRDFLVDSFGKERTSLNRELLGLIEQLIAHEASGRLDQLIQIEGLLLKFLSGSSYRETGEEIADFVERRSFISQRQGKRGFWQRILGK